MRSFVLVAIIAGLFTAGCIFSGGGGKDKDSRPRVTSISLADDARLTTSELTITWRGNDSANQYRFELDGTVSAWIDTTSVHYTDLAEGAHLFTVTARRDTVIGEPAVRHFTIDILQEPAVVFSVRRVSGIAAVSVGVEGADSLMAAHIEIVCENGSARIIDFTPESGDQRVVLSDVASSSHLALDAGFTGTPDEGATVTIGSMLVQPIQTGGRIYVDSEATLFRDFNNKPITINGFDEIQVGK